MSDLVSISPRRSIGGLVAQITVEEHHDDELEISEHPVEQGPDVTDHSFKRPSTLSIRCAWSNSSENAAGNDAYVRDIYQQLLDLQATRQPLEVITGKRAYSAMLIRSLSVTTDAQTEYALFADVGLREVILVETLSAAVPAAADMADPTKTGPVRDIGPQQLQPAPNVNQSALSALAGG